MLARSVLVGSLLLVVACGRNDADLTPAEEARVKVAHERAEAQREADRRAREAQLEADEKAAKETIARTKDQIAYRDRVQKKLNDLDRRVLHFRAGSAPNDLTARRDALRADLLAIDRSGTDWPALKDRIDHDLDLLEEAVKTASRSASRPREGNVLPPR
jgi:hypothetical protein